MATGVFKGVPTVDQNLRVKGDQIIPTDYRKILADIERALQEGWGWFGFKFIDEGRLYDLLNRLEAALPEDIRRAPEVLRQAEMELNNARQQAKRILEEAQAQGERIVDEAQRQAQNLVAEHEVTRQAEAKAQEMIRDAAKQADQTRQEAEQYAHETRFQADQYGLEVRASVEAYARQVLEHLDHVITRAKQSVEEGLAEMSDPARQDPNR
jgi:F0F1-type ATP synthase membrane subunit b/b'